MSDWKDQLKALDLPEYVPPEGHKIITLPNHFIFKNHGILVFDPVFNFFDWEITDTQVTIDFTKCVTANYQAVSLVVLYSLRLRNQGCRISYELAEGDSGASAMWRKMGASGLFNVSTDEKTFFKHNEYKPLIAIRNTADFKRAVSRVEEFAEGFNVEYLNTLRHVISELLYNTREHGVSHFTYAGEQIITPSIIQFTWYQMRDEIHFIVADIGVGIKTHLSQTYKGLESDIEAIRLAIKPQVSGTFGVSNPYESKDNAGVGLYISTNIVKRLKADMHIISGDGVLHISPRDITDSVIQNPWPGTVVLVSVKLSREADFQFHSMMQEFRESARIEIKKKDMSEADKIFYLNIENYFGQYAEDKQAAIKIRHERILPALEQNKVVVVDFDRVQSAPHSFLSALLATPIMRVGIKSFKRIKIINAIPEIRETLDYIFDENTEV